MIEEKLSYDDISIVPERVTTIRHRNECNPLDENGMLPIFTAPMSSVVSLDNWKTFNNNAINVVIPRNIPLEKRVEFMFANATDETKMEWQMRPFVALSLTETQDIFVNSDCTYKNILLSWKQKGYNRTIRICIDIANGHMNELLDTIKKIKDKFGKQVLVMSGNIANPESYRRYEKAGCDYVRCCIGTGKGCLTASNVGVYYPAFSLIREIWKIKKEIGGKCKIIADGGIDCFRNIQKALLYADYVMIGGLFNQMLESAAPAKYECFYKVHKDGSKTIDRIKTFFNKNRVVYPQEYHKVMEMIRDGKCKVVKSFYGMSTKKAQEEIADANGIVCKHLKTSEGKIIIQEVLYNIPGWVDNEMSYLKSAMSYTNSRTLEEYKDSEWVKNKDIKYNK